MGVRPKLELSSTQAGLLMFFFRHPKPVVDGRAVAVQVVQQKTTNEVSRTVLIVETPPVPTPDAPAVPDVPVEDR
jgi:hypothetical protein